MAMDSKQIRETVFTIRDKVVKSSWKDDKQKKSVQDSAQKLLSQLDGEQRSIERLYFKYLLIDILNQPDISKEKTKDFISVIFPSMLKKRQAALISQLISLALTLRHSRLLDCMEPYLTNCDSIQFPPVLISSTLAHDSPTFCAAVISRGYFTLNNNNKVHLTQWLEILIDSLPNNSLVLNHAIRFSFMDSPTDYKLHLVILKVIQCKKCQTLNNHFLIDLATCIKNKQENDILIDRFAQLIIIASGNNMCSQSNQLKNILLDKFNENVIINAACK